MTRSIHLRTTLAILAGAALTTALTGTASAEPAASDVTAPCSGGLEATASALLPCTDNPAIAGIVGSAHFALFGSAAVVITSLPGGCGFTGGAGMFPCSPTGSAGLANQVMASISGAPVWTG